MTAPCPRAQARGGFPGPRATFPSVAALVVCASLAVGLAACGDDDSGGPPQVVATTGILADVAEQVAGEDAEVVQLVPDSADPHSFSLSAEDRQTLEEAALVVANGAGLEAGIPVDEAGASWTLTDHVGELRPFADEDGEGTDPHVWMDPTRVAAAHPSLAEALGDADPDRAMQARLERVPEENRELVTSHDSLGYFADRYGFEVLATAFPATGAEAEASAARLAEVEDAVRESGVPAIFAQEGDDPEALDLVAQNTGVEVEYGLLVEAPAAAGTYEEMLRRDAALIAGGLGG
jgi:zinc/manganese transport system substrate-binding protein